MPWHDLLHLLHHEGPAGARRRLRRRLAGGQADVLRDYPRWLAAGEPRAARGPGDGLLVSVVTPVRDPPPWALRALVESLRAQTHARWELCLADDASDDRRVRAALVDACRDDRVRLARHASPRGIAAATNLALSLASGELIAFVDHDDLLAPDALRRLANALAGDPAAGFAFCDEDKLDARGRRRAPFFKPALDATLLLRMNAVSHLLVARHDLVRRVGGLRPGLDGAQDHDLVLRLAEAATRALHVPHVLYHWRALPGSTARSAAAKPGAHAAGRRAVADALRRRGVAGTVAPGEWLGSHRVTLAPAVDPGEVSVVCDAEAPPPWLRGAGAGEVLAGAGGLTAGRAALAARARGRFVLLVGPVTPRGCARAWLEALLGEAALPGVGVVAPQVVCEGRVVEQGLLLGHGPHAAAGPLEPGAPEDDLGYFGLGAVPRTVAAASGLALLVAREALEAAGGLDAAAFPSAGPAGADLCLRAARAGLRTVVTPAAPARLDPTARARHDLALGAARTALRGRAALAPDDPWSHPAFARGTARLRLADRPVDAPPRAIDPRTGAWWGYSTPAPGTIRSSR
ncbi:MAG: glycosyltransferase [Planctomycetes bacterium]|nr:glycosyltransferase [Planctomycetota bacterium]